jgi:hypothetical protein
MQRDGDGVRVNDYLLWGLCGQPREKSIYDFILHIAGKCYDDFRAGNAH